MLQTLSAQTLIIVLIISGIPLLLSAASGLLISVLQAASSVQDQSISYVVKLVTLVGSLYLCGEWFLDEILGLLRQTLTALIFIGN